MAFDREQKAIARGATGALAVTVVTLMVAGYSNWLDAQDQQQRLTLFAFAMAVLAISLFINIARLANHRFIEPLDRNAAAAATSTEKAAMLSAVLNNTHEQVTLAALVYANALILLPQPWTDAVAGCATLFLIGRLTFAAGYAKGAGGRAFGFGLTFYPTVALGLLTAVSALF